jgi:hypothetical protein
MISHYSFSLPKLMQCSYRSEEVEIRGVSNSVGREKALSGWFSSSVRTRRVNHGPWYKVGFPPHPGLDYYHLSI